MPLTSSPADSGLPMRQPNRGVYLPDLAAQGPIHVHLVAPPLVAWGLQRLVQDAGAPFCLTGVSSTMAEVLQSLGLLEPDVLVLDLDDGYGPEDVTWITERLCVGVLVLTSRAEPAFVQQILDAGARGVLHKCDAPAALLKAIEEVGHGEVFAPSVDTSRLFMAAAKASRDSEGDKLAKLTSRERQTMAAVTGDASAPAKVIASRLCISEHTLRNHLTSIYSKLGVSGRLGLYAFASLHKLNKQAPGAGHLK